MLHGMFSPPSSFSFTAGELSEPLHMARVFSMHNSGSSPLVLQGVGIGGGSCEEYGFAVAHCQQPITIKQNSSHTIEIT